jgi:hypothetical protein
LLKASIFGRASFRDWSISAGNTAAGNNQLRNTACGTGGGIQIFLAIFAAILGLVLPSWDIQPRRPVFDGEICESGDIAWASYKQVERLPYETENFYRVPTGPGSRTRFGSTKAASSTSAATGVSRPRPEGSHSTLLPAPRVNVFLLA